MDYEIPKDADIKEFSKKLTPEQLDVFDNMVTDGQQYISASTMQMSMYGALLKANPELKPSGQICDDVKDLATHGGDTIKDLARMAEIVKRGDGGTPEALKAGLDSISSDAKQMKQGLDEALKVPLQACTAPKMGM